MKYDALVNKTMTFMTLLAAEHSTADVRTNGTLRVTYSISCSSSHESLATGMSLRLGRFYTVSWSWSDSLTTLWLWRRGSQHDKPRPRHETTSSYFHEACFRLERATMRDRPSSLTLTTSQTAEQWPLLSVDTPHRVHQCSTSVH